MTEQEEIEYLIKKVKHISLNDYLNVRLKYKDNDEMFKDLIKTLIIYELEIKKQQLLIVIITDIIQILKPHKIEPDKISSEILKIIQKNNNLKLVHNIVVLDRKKVENHETK